MGEYWGATADPNYGYSSYSGQQHYASHPVSQIPFTAPPGPGNPLTPETVVAKIRNMHPEQMAALADQWQNAWTFLAEVRHFVVQQSTVLQDEHWRSPAARDAFLRRGPGEALTYLDVWMDAVQRNVTALRHLVLVSQQARQEAEQLMQRYEREMREAQAIGFGENLGAFLTRGQSWGAAAREEVAEDVSGVTERYRREAQALAVKYGDQYFDYIAVVANGAGPPVQPVNGSLSAPAVPAVPGGPGFVTSPVAHQPGDVAPPGGVQPPGVQPPGALPPGALPPGALPPGVVPPVVRPPAVVPPGGSLPPPGALPPGTVPPVVRPPGSLPPGALPGLPGQPGGSGTPPGAAQPPLPGQFGRGGQPGATNLPPPNSAPPPGRAVRRPSGPAGAPPAAAAPPQAGREIRRSGGVTGQPPPQPLPPPQRRRAEDHAAGRTPGARPPAGTGAGAARASTLPVLKNAAEKRERRPGSKEELGSPPVLGRPAPPAAAAPPPGPARRDRGALAWLNVFGARNARSGTVEPPQRARPESDPPALRSRAAAAPKPATVPSELSKRRPSGEPAGTRADGDIVTDDQAFGVRTPGGGVVKRG